MTLSRRADYVLRAAIFLASCADEPGFRTLDDVSRRMAIPRTYTPHILGALVRAGLAEARAGRGGGYRLTFSPQDISVLDVIEIGEGDIRQNRCPLRGVPCHWGTQCAVHPTLSRASDAIRATLRATTLAEVAREDRALSEAEQGRSPKRSASRPRSRC
ncbi:MAG TPA: Rrf2 family transcriptional regulator [Actinomycetota bacterium]|nr:Rrf2 family transcriptional regulator [Actinomycetota bacterium]